jgi:hypothetical protein
MTRDQDLGEQDPRERADAGAERDEDAGEQDQSEQPAEGGAESYGGDPDTEPSVTEREVERGMERDQAEG